MGDFAAQIKEFSEKFDRRADDVVRKIVLNLGASLVNKSPVGDAKYWKNPAPIGYTGGRFRANWQHGEGRYPRTSFDLTDKSGEISLQRIAISLGRKAAGKVHFLVNNLPYAIALEDGHSKNQAPQGIVGLTVLEFEKYVERAAQ